MIYRLDGEEGYQQLYWRVTNQHAIPRPEVGEIKQRPEGERPPLFPEPEPVRMPDNDPRKAGLEKYRKTLKRQIMEAYTQLGMVTDQAAKVPIQNQIEHYDREREAVEKKLGTMQKFM
jgi:hypothetical protein